MVPDDLSNQIGRLYLEIWWHCSYLFSYPMVLKWELSIYFSIIPVLAKLHHVIFNHHIDRRRSGNAILWSASTGLFQIKYIFNSTIKKSYDLMWLGLNWWNFCTNGQLFVKHFHVMTSCNNRPSGHSAIKGYSLPRWVGGQSHLCELLDLPW